MRTRAITTAYATGRFIGTAYETTAGASRDEATGYTVLPFGWQQQPFFNHGNVEAKNKIEASLSGEDGSDRLRTLTRLFTSLTGMQGLSLRNSRFSVWAKRHRKCAFLLITTPVYMVRARAYPSGS